MNIQIVGVPSFAGALYKGTEQAPHALREANILEELKNGENVVVDHGDLLVGQELPRHNVGPVRNWPAPRMVWEQIYGQAEELFEKDSFTFLLGGDCSILVGSFTAFQKVYGQNSYLLVIDGHVDNVEPIGEKCIGAAASGLWFLTEGHQTWWGKGEKVSASNITVMGPHMIPEETGGLNILSLTQLQNDCGMHLVKEYLSSLPNDAHIFVHFDVDVLHESVMPAAYSPNSEGMSFEKASDLFKMILSDSRVKGLEISEFSADKDTDGTSAKVIIDLVSKIVK